MKELLIISGKGGTGKTVVTGSFASLAENKVVVPWRLLSCVLVPQRPGYIGRLRCVRSNA